MRNDILLIGFLIAAPLYAADSRLDSALSQVAKYNYDQGRQPLLDLEALIQTMPRNEVEKRLLEFLGTDTSIAGRDFICRQLSLIGSDASVPVLVPMLAGADTVEMARYALERIPGPAATSALRSAFDKAPEQAKPGIVDTLGVRRDADAVAMIEKLTASSDKVLAECAIAALGRIASPRALNALSALRKAGSVPAMESSLVAADVLVAHGDRSAAAVVYRELSLPGAPAMIRIGGMRGLASTGDPSSVKALSAAMRDPDLKVQAAAIRFLSAIPGSEPASALMDALPKLGPEPRVRVITALGQREDRTAIPVLVKAARDEDEGVRMAAYAGLSFAGEASVVGLLAQVSSSAGEDERATARASLDRMRGKSADGAIITAIGDASPGVKAELIRSAGERGSPDSADVILRAARDEDRNVRRAALRALRDTAGASQVTPLLALLSSSLAASDRHEVERALGAALRRSPATRAGEIVSAYGAASSPETAASLLQVMGQSGLNDVLPVLRKALDNGNPDVVRAAILGLTDWPNDAPMQDLLDFAARAPDASHQVLALRGFLTLMELPAQRSNVDAVRPLAAAMKIARQPGEKKAILSLLARYPTPEALQLADAAAADPEVANEARAASQRLRRALPAK